MHKDAAEWYRLNTDEGLSYTAIAKRYNLIDKNGKPRRGLVAGAIREYKKAQHSSAPQSINDPLPEPGVKDTEQDNTRTIEHTGRIISLEQLLERAQVDLSVWAVERHVINKWEMGRKDIHKSITWEDGVANGFTEDSGRINVEPLYQVKIWLVRREPVAIKPVLRPVNINLKLPAVRPQRVRGMKAAVMGADAHFGFRRDWRTGELEPFHSRRSLSILLQLIEAIEPDWSILAGDWLDYANWSGKFPKEPEFVATTQPALIEAAYIAARVSAASGKTTMLEGNHDLRPERAIRENYMEGFGLCAVDNLDLPVYSVPHLLGLERRGVEYIGGYPDGAIWLNDHARIIHGYTVRGQPGATAGAVVREANETTGFGHIHRREMASRTIRARDGYRTITAFCPGCLCHIDGRVPGSKASDQWQQGLAVIWYDDERSTVIPVEIDNGQAVYNGQVFAGVDYAADLRREYGAWGF